MAKAWIKHGKGTDKAWKAMGKACESPFQLNTSLPAGQHYTSCIPTLD